MAPQFFAQIAVEGDPDEAVLRRLVSHAGGRVTDVYGKEGDDFLRERVQGYNADAQRSPWCVIVDLDRKKDCAPGLVRDWLPEGPAPGMCFRVVVRSIEAWLMADSTRLSSYLQVSPDQIPQDVEAIDHPKRKMVSIARESTSRRIRQDMVPREGSRRRVGPAYTSRLVEFAHNHWRPSAAAERCDSLSRAVDCIENLEPPH